MIPAEIAARIKESTLQRGTILFTEYGANVAVNVNDKESLVIFHTLTGNMTLTIGTGTNKLPPYIGDKVNFLFGADGTNRTITFSTGFHGAVTVEVSANGYAYKGFRFNGIAWVEENTPGGSTGYLSYVALLSQAGTSAPSDGNSGLGLQNTVAGGACSFTRPSIGKYKITSANSFPINKTIINGFGSWEGNANPYMPISDGSSIVGYYTIYPDGTNDDDILIEVRNSSFVLTDWSTLADITKLFIKVEVYP